MRFKHVAWAALVIVASAFCSKVGEVPVDLAKHWLMSPPPTAPGNDVAVAVQTPKDFPYRYTTTHVATGYVIDIFDRGR